MVARQSNFTHEIGVGTQSWSLRLVQRGAGLIPPCGLAHNNLIPARGPVVGMCSDHIGPLPGFPGSPGFTISLRRASVSTYGLWRFWHGSRTHTAEKVCASEPQGDSTQPPPAAGGAPPACPAEPGFAGAPPHEGYVFWVKSPCGLDAHTFEAVRVRDPRQK